MLNVRNNQKWGENYIAKEPKIKQLAFLGINTSEKNSVISYFCTQISLRALTALVTESYKHQRVHKHSMWLKLAWLPEKWGALLISPGLRCVKENSKFWSLLIFIFSFKTGILNWWCTPDWVYVSNLKHLSQIEFTALKLVQFSQQSRNGAQIQVNPTMPSKKKILLTRAACEKGNFNGSIVLNSCFWLFRHLK